MVKGGIISRNIHCIHGNSGDAMNPLEGGYDDEELN